MKKFAIIIVTLFAFSSSAFAAETDREEISVALEKELRASLEKDIRTDLDKEIKANLDRLFKGETKKLLVKIVLAKPEQG